MRFSLQIIFVLVLFMTFTVGIRTQAPLSGRDAELYEFAKTDIGKFAHEVTRNESSELAQAQTIVKWLATRFEWKATDYEKRSVQQIVDRRGGNCNELAMVALAAMESLHIRLRRVHEVNIYKNTPRRGDDAHAMVKEKGLAYSVFGRHHNDHVWLELYDSKAKEWFPADPSSGLVGTDEWLKGRVWFGKRVTLNPLTKEMIVPFAIFAMDDNGKYTINRTQHYLIDEFDRLYRGKLHKSTQWKDWVNGVTFLSHEAGGALAGTTNLHDYEKQIDSLAETYDKLKQSADAGSR